MTNWYKDGDWEVKDIAVTPTFRARLSKMNNGTPTLTLRKWAHWAQWIRMPLDDKEQVEDFKVCLRAILKELSE